ncbi:MAG TPA: hypothetical protein VNT20_20190 [Flavisolibacter sp.]|jgi:hypothetical protein|nr:hypothetical protein [Flavisolibacter sp.]
MKKYFLAIVLMIVFTAISYSQQNDKPKWLSKKGYWLVESNLSSPKSSVIYFYNNDNVLVYKENVEGLRVKINKTKVKMSLKKILEASVTAWEKKHISRENDYLVATALKK